VSVGKQSLNDNTTGSSNTAIGVEALIQNTTASNNTAVGYQAGYSNTTGASNTSLGTAALYSNTTGDENVAIGRLALYSNTTASDNTAVGRRALYSNVTGTFNVAVGYQALDSNSNTSQNTAVGVFALQSSTAANNTALGYSALYNNTSAEGGTAVGYQALFSNTTPSYGTAVGYQALRSNTTGASNVAMGYEAGYGNTTGSSNMYLGYRAGKANTTSNNNVYIGLLTGEYNSGSDNTFVGTAAGNSMSSGSKNTILGRYNGNQGGLDIRTSSNNIVLSDGDGNPRLHIDSSGKTSIGSAPLSAKLNIRDSGNLIEFDHPSYGDIARIGSTGDNIVIDGTVVSGVTGIRFAYGRWGPRASSAASDNFVDLGSASERFDDLYATNGTIQTSDQNEKQQIASLTDAEITAAKAISKLFKTFKWNDSVAEKGAAARTHSGVIAQEVEQAMTDAGLNAGDYAFFISTAWWEADGETYENAEDAPEGATERNRKGIRYPQLLSFIGAATEQRLASIEGRLDALENA